MGKFKRLQILSLSVIMGALVKLDRQKIDTALVLANSSLGPYSKVGPTMTDANSSPLATPLADLEAINAEATSGPSPFQTALRKSRMTSPEALALKAAVAADPSVRAFKAIVRSSKKPVKDKPLPSVKAAKIATRRVKDLSASLTVICPITGLVVPSNLPPFLGMVLEARHPMAYNALAILDLPMYIAELTLEQQCALILASLAALDKLDLQDSSLMVLTCLENALTSGQARIFLGFIDDAIRRTSRHYPKLTLDRSINEDGLLSYMIRCVEVENYAGDVSWAAANPLAGKAPIVISSAPAFLSSQKSGKRLDKACYDAWLEVAPYLPKAMVAKAGPFIKTLASTLDGRTIERMVEATINYCLEDKEAALYAVEFKSVVEENRKTAANLGLHRDYLDADLGLASDLGAPDEASQLLADLDYTPVAKAAANAVPSPEAPKVEAGAVAGAAKVDAKPSLFAQRMAARAAAASGV